MISKFRFPVSHKKRAAVKAVKAAIKAPWLAVKKTWAKVSYLRKVRKRKKSDKPAFYIFMTPNHLNVGDMAILESAKAFARERFPDYEQVLFDLDESSVMDSLILSVVRPGDMITIF